MPKQPPRPLAEVRADRHLSQRALADATGNTVSLETISNVERSVVVPSLASAQALARALHVSTDDVAWPLTATPPASRRDRYARQKAARETAETGTPPAVATSATSPKRSRTARSATDTSTTDAPALAPLDLELIAATAAARRLARKQARTDPHAEPCGN